ncbi:bromodomain-containing protein 8 isoform X2 [Halyomorpha halys]|uniref:bromodomain-containing protein 8 isoform X2 n=1 Tax=Halyomorpha halys TaxID=286706 RepID=UPI0006D52253|nr:titin isoform X2 [Halyomorpha halys]
MKKFQLENWNTFDKFCLMSAITKLTTSFVDQNWVAISRYTKQLHENISSFIQYDNRSDEWFSAKQCSAQYEILTKGSGARKKKKIDKNVDYTDYNETLLMAVHQEFCNELQLSLMDIRAEFLKTKLLIDELDSDEINDNRLEELIVEYLEKEKVTDIKTKLKSMLDEKNATECESSSKYLSQTLLPNEPSTSSEHKTANITTSPLLTSLLQSPSPLVRPSPSTSSPTISLLLHSSPSVSLSEKQLHTGEEISVQRAINDPEEFQRTEGFDDMSDIEQGVVESEVIIENESSPIKRLTPRRLDLENIGDEEPEEEILETVEEIIERVEEAIIETVGENSLNELVLNEGIDTVSISDEEIENISIEDNTYEVIVVGSQEEGVPSSNETSDSSVVIEESISKLDNIKNVESDDAGKNSEIFPVEDPMRIEVDTSKSVHQQNVDMREEISLMKDSKENEKSCVDIDTKFNKEKSEAEVNFSGGVEEEVSKRLITCKEKPVEDTVISVHEKLLEKLSENDRLCDSDVNREVTLTEKSLTVDSDISANLVERSISLASEGNDSTTSCNFEVLINEQVKENDHSQHIPVSNDSVTNMEIVKPSLLDSKQIEKKLTEEIELVISENEVEIKSHEEILKVRDSKRQSNKIEGGNGVTDKIPELKGDHQANSPQNVSKGIDEKEQLELCDQGDLEKYDINTEEASKSDKIVVFMDSQQSAALTTSSDEKKSSIPETVVEKNLVSQGSAKNLGYETADEDLVGAAESGKDHIISVDSNSRSSEELLIDSKEVESTLILNPNIAGEPNLFIDKPEKKNSNTTQVVSDILKSEDEQEQVNVKNKPFKDDKKLDIDNVKQRPSIIEGEKKPRVETIENNTSSMPISEEIYESHETLETQENLEVKETHEIQETNKAQESPLEAKETQEALEIQEPQETHDAQEAQETNEVQESHDDFEERTSNQIYIIESDESKSDSTEETEDNSILTTEDSKDGLDDSLKFSSLETLSMPSVDSPPEYTDPKFAGLCSKEREFRSLIGKGFEELKNKAAELVFVPESPRKHAKPKNKPRTKKEKPFKTRKMTEKTNWEKLSENKTPKEKTSKDRASKDKPSNEKYTNSGRKSKYLLSAFDSKPDSPSLSTTSSDEDRDYKSWKKSILLVYNRLASHKYASVFSKPITENEAPSYHQLILRPMDLSTIKRNIENGVIRTTVEFQRDMLLMVQNAIIYNKYDTPVYDMAKAMGEDMLAQMEVMVQALGDGVPLIGDTSEEKQITRARTSKSSIETPQAKKRKTQEPDEIRPKRNKLSTSC